MNAGLRNLSRRHGVKVPVGVEFSVEECGLAAGEVVGCDSIKALSRMNGAVVMFLDAIDKVNSFRTWHRSEKHANCIFSA